MVERLASVDEAAELGWEDEPLASGPGNRDFGCSVPVLKRVPALDGGEAELG